MHGESYLTTDILLHKGLQLHAFHIFLTKVRNLIFPLSWKGDHWEDQFFRVVVSYNLIQYWTRLSFDSDTALSTAYPPFSVREDERQGSSCAVSKDGSTAASHYWFPNYWTGRGDAGRVARREQRKGGGAASDGR